MTETSSRSPHLQVGVVHPKWTLTKSCLWEFGNMANGNDFGADSQYGSIPANLGYPEFLGPIQSNTCPTAVVPTS